MVEIKHEQVTALEMRREVHQHSGAHKPFVDVCVACVDLMVAGRGGAIIVIGNYVSDDSRQEKLRLSTLDDHTLRKVYRQHGGNVLENGKDFATIFDSSCEHTASDKWEQPGLDRLASRLGLTLAELEDLKGQPMDGAVMLSAKGTVVGAAMQIGENSQYKLIHEDGSPAGTRHRGALAAAEWFGKNQVVGMVLVRSDSGGVHALLPSRHGQAQPKVMFVRQD